MNSAKVWLRWVREGSAYTITKSRRKKIKRERLLTVMLFFGYAVLCAKMKRMGIAFGGSDIKQYERSLEEYGFTNMESLGLSLIRLIGVKDFDDDKTIERLSRMCSVISSLYFYFESEGYSVIHKVYRDSIHKAMKDLNASDAGAIVRKAFKDIELELIRKAKLNEWNNIRPRTRGVHKAP